MASSSLLKALTAAENLFKPNGFVKIWKKRRYLFSWFEIQAVHPLQKKFAT